MSRWGRSFQNFPGENRSPCSRGKRMRREKREEDTASTPTSLGFKKRGDHRKIGAPPGRRVTESFSACARHPGQQGAAPTG